MAIELKPTITLKEVLDVLFNRSVKYPTPFSIIAVSCDLKRDKGGDILKLDNVIVPNRSRKPKAQIDTSEEAAHKPFIDRMQNNTINLLNKMTDKYIKVHIDLIVEYNNQKVIW